MDRPKIPCGVAQPTYVYPKAPRTTAAKRSATPAAVERLANQTTRPSFEDVRGLTRRVPSVVRLYDQPRQVVAAAEDLYPAPRPKQGVNLARYVALTDTPEIETEAHPGFGTTGWVAELVPQTPTWGSMRLDDGKVTGMLDVTLSFQSPDREELSRAGNGHRYYRLSSLGDGVYLAESVWRSYATHRTFVLVRDGSPSRA
jgi:hypothetical protein